MFIVKMKIKNLILTKVYASSLTRFESWISDFRQCDAANVDNKLGRQMLLDLKNCSLRRLLMQFPVRYLIQLNSYLVDQIK